MEPRANYALIGAFVLAAAAALMGFILWLSQAQFRQAFEDYDIVFQGPVTLDQGASVRYIGIKVGEVAWVRIDRADPSRVRARVRIDAETPVKTDSVATIDFAGITGVTFVQISAGSTEAPELARQPGQPVPVIRSERTQLVEIFTSGQEVLARSGETVERINALLSDDNLKRIERTLANIEQVSQRLAAEDGPIENANATLTTFRRAGESFDNASATLAEVGRDINEALVGIESDLDGLASDADELIAALLAAAEEAQVAISATGEVVDGPARDAFEQMRVVGLDLRRLIGRMERVARDFEDNPQRIVMGDPLPYEER